MSERGRKAQVHFMITAEVNYWSVVFYGNAERSSRDVLRSIYDSACALDICTGSVAVFDLPKDAETLVHIDLMHCNMKQARQVLARAGVPLQNVTFVNVSTEWNEDASRRNRKKRLRG